MKKPTSWQRRKAAKLGVAPAEVQKRCKKKKSLAGPAQALRDACKRAKDASAASRERHRLGQPPQPEDAALAEEYSQAKAALRRALEAEARERAAAAQKTAAGTIPAEPASTAKGAAAEPASVTPASTAKGVPSGGTEAAAEAPPPPSKKELRRREAAERAVAERAGEGGGDEREPWTCETCGVTILVRPDGRARQQHLQGKAHAKRLRAAPATAASAGAPSAASASATAAAPAAAPAAVPAAVPAGGGTGYYECKLCSCTLASSAGALHEKGARHRERVQRLAAFLRERSAADAERPLKPGDWICTAASHAPQLVYANRDSCCRAGCGRARAQGLSQSEAATMVARGREGGA